LMPWLRMRVKTVLPTGSSLRSSCAEKSLRNTFLQPMTGAASYRIASMSS